MIREELDEKRAEAEADRGAARRAKRSCWSVVTRRARRGREGATATSAAPRSAARGEELEFDAEAFIVDEDANVVVTRDGWMKRVRELKDPTHDAPARGRRGAGACCRARRKANGRLLLEPRLGLRHRASTTSPASTGYGDPVQKLLQVRRRRADRRGAVARSARARCRRDAARGDARTGYGLRFALAPHTEVSTRAGRRYAQAGRGRRGRRRGRRATTSDVVVRGDARRPRAARARPTRSTSSRARAAASP